ncbi:MAG: methylcrotonoyl-CoA carboxylase, partial [Phenylobacterium sp.]|nr:methylcrotonoyl-CoA carboxylase [Phenylobacterium sp.]
MRKLSSAVDTGSEAFAANAAANRALAETLRSHAATAALGGPEDSRTRHVARGKLLPRDR